MKVVLVSSPTLAEHGDVGVFHRLPERDLGYPPLGLLTLAALLRRGGGCDVVLVDTNSLLQRWILERRVGVDPAQGRADAAGAGHGGGPSPSYEALVAAQIESARPDWVGFSSICSCYHVTLALAGELKRRNPGIPVVLGGPQASATALATLEQCPSVDYVLCGEAEESIGLFLEQVVGPAGVRGPDQVPGLAWRENGAVRCNSVEVPATMEQTPPPAWDLWEGTTSAEMPLEVGRGCPFNCRFCSTSGFFGRRYRIKRAEQVVQEALELTRTFGCSSMELIHDHLAANRAEFLALCRAWRREPALAGVTWSCSLRADSLDDEVVEALKGSGCTAVFIGVETGSARMQKVIGKRLNLERCKESLQRLCDVGLKFKVAFIAGFPGETVEDFADTLKFLEWTLFLPGARPQITTLAPVAGSGYGEEFGRALVFTGNLSDIAAQNASYDEKTLAFLRGHPELCSTHFTIPLEGLDLERVYLTVRFLKYANGLLGLPLRAGVRLAGGLLELLELWFSGRVVSRLLTTEYYVGGEFRTEFLDFLRGLPVRLGCDDEVSDRMRCLVDMHSLPEPHVVELRRREGMRADGPGTCPDPVLIAGCTLSRYPYPFEGLSEAVLRGRPLPSVRRSESIVARSLTDEGVSVSAVSPLSAVILHTFSAGRAYSEGLGLLARNHGDLLPPGIPVEAAFSYAIQSSVDNGLLWFASPE